MLETPHNPRAPTEPAWPHYLLFDIFESWFFVCFYFFAFLLAKRKKSLDMQAAIQNKAEQLPNRVGRTKKDGDLATEATKATRNKPDQASQPDSVSESELESESDTDWDQEHGRRRGRGRYSPSTFLLSHIGVRLKVELLCWSRRWLALTANHQSEILSATQRAETKDLNKYLNAKFE